MPAPLQRKSGHAHGARRRLALRLIAGALCSGAALAGAQQQPASEVAVKAAYLYKFLAYVDWPAGLLPAADTPIVIGAIGADAVQAELEAIVAGRHVNGRPVLTRKLGPADALDGVHVVFVGRSVHASVLERLRGRAILVVAESGLDPGVMLNFVPVGGRVRFEAAPSAAERVGIKLGVRLLSVAERVLAQ